MSLGLVPRMAGPTGATGASNSKSTGIGNGFSIDLSVKSDFNFDDLDA